MAEAAGIEGFNIGTWYGIFAPAATPDAVVQTLNAQINQALADEKVVQFLEVQEGAQIRRSTPEELQQLLQSDIPRWQKVIETAKVEL